MTAAAIEATQLLHLCTPRYLALVGIAAGMDSAWKTGDMLFAKTCFHYAAGKIESGENSKITFTPDGDGIEIAPSLVEWARIVEREADLRLAVQADWVEGTSGGSFPRIHIGPLASGPFVVASDVVRAMIHASAITRSLVRRSASSSGRALRMLKEMVQILGRSPHGKLDLNSRIR